MSSGGGSATGGAAAMRLSQRDIAKYKLPKPYPTDRPVVLAIRGRVYDVTSFVSTHPGGPDMLYSNSGIRRSGVLHFFFVVSGGARKTVDFACVVDIRLLISSYANTRVP